MSVKFKPWSFSSYGYGGVAFGSVRKTLFWLRIFVSFGDNFGFLSIFTWGRGLPPLRFSAADMISFALNIELKL